MKKNLFKIVLPIFLIGVLCTTLYFTYGNKNTIERVKAGMTDVMVDDGGGGSTCKKVSCSRTVTTCSGPLPYYTGTCSCTASLPSGGGQASQNINVTWNMVLSSSDCAAFCRTQIFNTTTGAHFTGGTGTLTLSCPGSGSINGNGCVYNVYDGNCTSPYTAQSSTTETQTYSNSCPTGWTQVAVTVPGCVSKPSSVTKQYTGSNLIDYSAYAYVSGDKTGINVGTYNTVVKPSGSYVWCTSDCSDNSGKTLTTTITGKTINVSWNNGRLTNSSISGADGETVNLSITWTKEGGGSGSGTPTAAGTYTLTASCTSVSGGNANCGNYSLSGNTTTYTVTSSPSSYPSATAPTTSICKTGLTYTGSEQQITTVTSGTGYTLSGYNQTNAGTYTVTATLTGNYRWGGTGTGTKTVDCTIAAKDASITWSNHTFVEDGNAHSQSPSVTLVSGESMKETATYWTKTFKDSNNNVLSEAPKTAGTYSVSVTCKKVDGGQAKCENYNFKNTSVTYTINAAGSITVSLDKTIDEVEVGKTIQLTPTVTGTENRNVSWSSDNTAVATVNGGVVTGVSTGTATITVTTDEGNKTATATITVVEASTPTVAVTGVTIAQPGATISVGETVVLIAVVAPENASNKNVTWTSNRTSVATVRNGVVTGVSAGTATITATTVDGNRTATAEITVTESSVIPVHGSINFESAAYTCSAGKTISTVVTYTGLVGAFTPTITSSDSSVVESIVLVKKKVCSGTDTTRCLDMTSNEVTNCGANGTEVVASCVSLTHTYDVTISCKSVGEATLTATVADNVSTTASVTVNEAGSEYSITFDANGGVLTYDGDDEEALIFEGDGTTTIEGALADAIVSREGYTFLGWFADPEDGTEFAGPTEFGSLGVTTLYAHWALIDGTRFTLTYNSNGGSACSPATITVDAGTAWGTLCTPKRKGYDFAGWYTAKNGGLKVAGTSLADKSLTVYAHWIVNPQTGISTPVIALLVVALASVVAFLVIRKKKAASLE